MKDIALTWRYRHRVALWLGGALAGLDILIYALLANDVLSNALSLPMEAQFALSRYWAFLNGPAIRLFAAPYLAHLIPDHGGGWVALSAMIAYALVCSLQAFLFGFLIGEIYRALR